jgi:heavy metal sensor kinase
VSRLPIRLRLTLAFSLAMAVVLGATGLFVYSRLENELDRTLDASLRSRADVVSTLVQQADTGLRDSGRSRLTDPGDSFAQVIDGRGRILDATPEFGRQPLLGAQTLARARKTSVLIDRSIRTPERESVRLLAVPVLAQGQRLVVVAGASRDSRDQALASLRTQLFVGGPIALLLASLLAYALAAAALRQVESMRRRAGEISIAHPGRRLPVGKASDEVSRLATTLNEMLGRLEAGLARERNFVSDASHELRTPLALLKAELELSLRRKRSPEELEQALRSAAVEADRLAQLAEDLLVLARSEHGKLPVRPGKVKVAELFAKLQQRFSARTEGNDRSLVTAVPDGLELTGDELRLEQALGNLVENALRYGRGDVSLEAQQENGRVELHVVDEGQGFAPDFLPRAFERFSRGDPSRGSGGGSGLGLSIVQVIAAAHGGKAHAQNRAQGGADVWLDLPAREAP